MRKRINQKRKTTANVCSIDDMAGQQPSSSYFARPLNFGGDGHVRMRRFREACLFQPAKMGGRRPCNSFIKIKHGDNEQSVFNPDCPMKLLVDGIKKRCNCPTRELAVVGEGLDCHNEVVITDPTELPENMDNGRQYFSDRGSYVLLTLQRKGEQLEYEAMLDEECISPTLKDKIHALNNPKAEPRRPSRASKSKPPSRNSSRKTSTVVRKK